MNFINETTEHEKKAELDDFNSNELILRTYQLEGSSNFTANFISTNTDDLVMKFFELESMEHSLLFKRMENSSQINMNTVQNAFKEFKRDFFKFEIEVKNK